jgi:hypothetical protein
MLLKDARPLLLSISLAPMNAHPCVSVAMRILGRETRTNCSKDHYEENENITCS